MIQRVELANGVRLILPRRNRASAALKYAGDASIPGFFLALLTIFVFGIGPGKLFQSVIFAAFLSLFYAILVTLFAGFIYAALRQRIGRVVIEINNDRLSTTDRVGPIRFRFSHRLSTLTKLNIHVDESHHNRKKDNHDCARLEAAFGAHRGLTLVSAYPFNVVDEVAQRLCKEPLLKRYLSGATRGDLIEIVRHSSTSLDSTERNPPPIGSKIVVQPIHDGFRFILPSVGLFNSFGCLLLIWLLVTSPISYLFITGVVATPSTTTLGGIIFISILWTVALIIAIATIRTARQSAVLEVDQSGIRIQQHNVTPHSIEIPAGDVKAVRTHQHYPYEGNREQWLEIHRKCDKSIALFKERDLDELKWLASELRHILNVGWK